MVAKKAVVNKDVVENIKTIRFSVGVNNNKNKNDYDVVHIEDRCDISHFDKVYNFELDIPVTEMSVIKLGIIK